MTTHFKEVDAKSLLKYKKEKYPFEAYLQDIFNDGPGTMMLDDDLPDGFDNWLGGLDGDDMFTYANEFAFRLLKYVK